MTPRKKFLRIAVIGAIVAVVIVAIVGGAVTWLNNANRIDVPTIKAIQDKSAWLDRVTHGAITVGDFGHVWGWGDSSSTNVDFVVGACQSGVVGYIERPAHPTGPGQITMYLTIPGGDKKHYYQPPKIDFQISDAASVRRLVQVLLASDYRRCVVGDPRLQHIR